MHCGRMGTALHHLVLAALVKNRDPTQSGACRMQTVAPLHHERSLEDGCAKRGGHIPRTSTQNTSGLEGSMQWGQRHRDTRTQQLSSGIGASVSWGFRRTIRLAEDRHRHKTIVHRGG